MVIWGRPSLPPLLLPTSRRSSSRRSSTSTSSCTSMSLSCSYKLKHNVRDMGTCSQPYSVRADDLLLSRPTPSRLSRDLSFIVLLDQTNHSVCATESLRSTFALLPSHCIAEIWPGCFISLLSHIWFCQIGLEGEFGGRLRWQQNWGLAISWQRPPALPTLHNQSQSAERRSGWTNPNQA